MQKTVFTTGDVATICGVSADTVSRWFDLGQIEGYRLGPGGDRRIPRDKLREFMLKHGIPLTRLDGEKGAILVLDEDPQYLENISSALKHIPSFDVVCVHTGFDCGVKVAEHNPQLIILDIEQSELDIRLLCDRVKKRKETHYTVILGMGNSTALQNPQHLMDAGFDAFIQKPFSGNDILLKAQEMLALPPGKINRPKHSIAV